MQWLHSGVDMIRKKSKKQKQIIDLTGPDGNAFVILSYAHRCCRQIGIDFKPVADQMMKGDYENLIQTFDKYFGDFFILER